MDGTQITFDLTGINATILQDGIQSTPSYFLHHLTPGGETTPHVVLPDGGIVLRSSRDNRGDFCNGTARLYAEQHNGLFFPENGGEFKMPDFLQALKFLRVNERDFNPEEAKKFDELFENPDSWKELEAEASRIPLVKPAFYTSDSHHPGHPVEHPVGLRGELGFGTSDRLGQGNLILVFHPHFAMSNLGIVGRVITDEKNLVSRQKAEYIETYLKGAERTLHEKYKDLGMSVKVRTKFKDKEEYGDLEFWLMSHYMNVDISYNHQVLCRESRKFQPVASSELMMGVWWELTEDIRKIEKGLHEERENKIPNHIREILAMSDKS